MIDELKTFEKIIIEAILDSSEESIIIDKLYKQYKNIKVVKRTISESGFFIDFYIKDQNLKLENENNLEMGGIFAKINGLNYGASFILYVRNGLIKALEGYCFDELWPNKIKILQLFEVKQDGTLVSR